MLRLQPDGHPWLFDLKLDGFRRIADTIAGWMLSKDENHLKLRPDHVEIGPHARLASIHFWQLRTRGGWTSLFLCCGLLTTSENRKFAVLMRIALTYADDPMSQFCNVPAEKASHVPFSPSSAPC
jgi:hypothetical protein